jgi:hypothetical protein
MPNAFSLSRESTKNRGCTSNAFHQLSKQIRRKIPAQHWELAASLFCHLLNFDDARRVLLRCQQEPDAAMAYRNGMRKSDEALEFYARNRDDD